MSRIGEGRLALAREPVELRELARDVVEAHRLMIDAAVELRLPTSPVWIHADATRIRQALGNLIANAAKVSRADDRILLRLASDETKGVAEVRVIDEGPGIDPAEVDRFFEPFVQSQHSMRRDQVGLGLGLSIVKGLVEAHDGRVRVNCKSAGSGAEFIIEVPLADTSILSQARERAGPVAEDDRQIAPTGGLSVLLIERRQT